MANQPSVAGARAVSAGRSDTRVPCAACQGAVDPLRAERVAIWGERVCYFCSRECHESYTPGNPPPPPAKRRHPRSLNRLEPALSAERIERLESRHVTLARRALFEVEDLGVHSELAQDPAIADPALEMPAAPAEVAEPIASTAADLGTLLLTLAVLGGALSLALLLVGDVGVALTARLLVAWVALAALITEAIHAESDAANLRPVQLLVPPIAAVLLATGARIIEPARAGVLVSLAGVVIAGVAGQLWLLRRARTGTEQGRRLLTSALTVPAQRVVGDALVPAAPEDLRPGEEVVVGSGELIPVDGTIVAGSAELEPWFGCTDVVTRGEGDPVVAGARLLEGRLRLVVSWAGYDRSWARLAIDPRRRADVMSDMARFGRTVVSRGAPLGAMIAALTAFTMNQGIFELLGQVVLTLAALGSVSLAELGALHVGRCILTALSRGIAFRSADALDVASHTSTVAFCARGTVLLGEPELASLEPFGTFSVERVLELIAGAESGASNPIATAIQRAARARGVRADAVRSPSMQQGLGVTAVASDGQPLIVGTRALMLREHVSVAVAEAKITELEALGRSVLLVALGGRLVGLVALQDGLRPGVRAAVQHVIDADVEPVLLSGEARETCEALGRTLDIDHIRPEILPSERAEEIQRLADGGAIVAVIGRSPLDDAALGAADVSVALATAGASSAEWHIQLASDDVRDAAYALRLAHRCRHDVRIGQALTLGAAALAMLGSLFTLYSPSVGALIAAVGGLAAVFRFQARTP